jgi:hypothetical protein
MTITQNDTPTIYDVLSDDNGPVNLAGYTVTFECQLVGGASFSRAATVTDAAAGKLQCLLLAADTATVGSYQAQWKAVNGGTVRTFPSEDYIRFNVVERVPITTPANVTLLSECHDAVRAILGDLHPIHRRYQAEAIDNVLRTVLRLGRVPGYGLTPNKLGITPTLTEARSFGLLVYHSAKMFLLPNVAASSYRLRAIGESFGEQKHFLFDLDNQLFDLTNGDGGVFVTFQSFYGWINAITGLNLFEAMTELKANAPVATATIGSDGLQVSS